MAALPWIAGGIAGGAQAVAAYKKKKAHEAQAAEYREAKNRRMGAATREMSEERRKQEFIQSRAVALAAASGAGTDAGFVKVLSDLNAEGEYRVMSMLWAGLNDAEGLLARAKAEEQAADDAVVLGVVNTVTSAVSAYAGAGGQFGKSAAAAGAGASGATTLSRQGYPMSPVKNPPRTTLWGDT